VVPSPPEPTFEVFDAIVVSHGEHGFRERGIDDEFSGRRPAAPGEESLPIRERRGPARTQRSKAPA